MSLLHAPLPWPRALLLGAALAGQLCAPGARAAPADLRPRLAVMDLQASGASASLSGAATGAVSSELDRLRVFQVVTSEAIRGMLALARSRTPRTSPTWAPAWRR